MHQFTHISIWSINSIAINEIKKPPGPNLQSPNKYKYMYFCVTQDPFIRASPQTDTKSDDFIQQSESYFQYSGNNTPATVWTEKTTINNFHQTHPPPFFNQKVWKENFLPCCLNSNNLIYLHHVFSSVTVLAVWTLIDCMYNDYVYIYKEVSCKGL